MKFFFFRLDLHCYYENDGRCSNDGVCHVKQNSQTCADEECFWNRESDSVTNDPYACVPYKQIRFCEGIKVFDVCLCRMSSVFCFEKDSAVCEDEDRSNFQNFMDSSCSYDDVKDVCNRNIVTCSDMESEEVSLYFVKVFLMIRLVKVQQVPYHACG
jgi:hypothetical protein